MTNSNKYNLTEGDIVSKLFIVALPLIATQIIQMAYNLTNIFWLGRLSSDAVAASATVGLFLWLSMAFMIFARMGAEIGVSQSIGRNEEEVALYYAEHSIIIAVVLGVLVALAFGLFRNHLVGFFNIQEERVAQDAKDYLGLVSISIPFTLIASAVFGIFSGSGNTRIPLLLNGIGLALNMLLDPLLIFTAKLGIYGAAYATIIAQVVTAVISFIVLLKSKNRPFKKIKIISKPNKVILGQIYKWVTPVALESFLFTFLSMITSTFINSYGSSAMAASRVSSQIEGLTWLISGGFSTALTAYTGQNFGALKKDRIKKGFDISSVVMACWGMVVALTIFFFGNSLISIFLPDDTEVIRIGTGYLKILAMIQIPGCLEGVAAGIFRGRGKTIPPTVSSVVSNSIRVVLAYILTRYTAMGVTGVFTAIAVSAGIRGVWTYIWYLIYDRRIYKNTDTEVAFLE